MLDALNELLEIEERVDKFIEDEKERRRIRSYNYESRSNSSCRKKSCKTNCQIVSRREN